MDKSPIKRSTKNPKTSIKVIKGKYTIPRAKRGISHEPQKSINPKFAKVKEKVRTKTPAAPKKKSKAISRKPATLRSEFKPFMM